MIAVLELCVDDVAVQNGHIVRDHKAVDRDAEARCNVVGFRGSAAGGNGSVLMQRHDQAETFWDGTVGNGMSPRVAFVGGNAEKIAGIAGKVLVEVASRNAVIARFIFALHIAEQQLKLPDRDGAVGGVGGEVQVIEHQFFAALDGNAADAVAAVKVDQLHQTRFDGELTAHGGVDPEACKGRNAGSVRPVRLGEGIEKIGTVIVLGENGIVSGKHAGGNVRSDDGQLIDVMGARTVHIDLLKKRDVRSTGADGFQRTGGVAHHGVRAARTAFFAAVHEEAVVRAVSAEADIAGCDPVALARLRHGGNGGVEKYFAFLRIFHAVVCSKHIGEVSAQCDHQRQQHAKRRFDALFDSFHESAPFKRRSLLSLCHELPVNASKAQRKSDLAFSALSDSIYPAKSLAEVTEIRMGKGSVLSSGGALLLSG